MAIFRASTKSFSRSKNQSAVASASYRAGVKLEDERYKKTHDYSKKNGVLSADIILPSSLANSKITIERSELWNKAERAEKRKDSRVAREWLISLPHELSEIDRKNLAHEFSQALADRYNVIADCAIHRPTKKEVAKGADARNFHAHIMLTTRKVEVSNDEIVLTDKSDAELKDAKRIELGLTRMSAEIKDVRKIWETLANKKLAEFNIEKIDSRSYSERKLDIKPQVKVGAKATQLERKFGIKTELSKINDSIKNRNERKLFEYQTLHDKNIKTLNNVNDFYMNVGEDGYADYAKQIVPNLKAKSFTALKENHFALSAINEEVTMQSRVVESEKQSRLEAEQAELERLRAENARELARKREQQRIATLQAHRAEQQRQAVEKQRYEQELKKSISQKTAFELLDLKVTKRQYRNDEDYQIGRNLLIPITNKKLGSDIEFLDTNNRHLHDNNTAMRIKNFMFKAINHHALDEKAIHKLFVDFTNSSIEDFTSKYSLKCDLSDFVNTDAELHVEHQIDVVESSYNDLDSNNSFDDYDLPSP